MGLSADQITYARMLLADPGSNAIQTVQILNAVDGTFTITYSGQTTAALAWNASAANVQNALAALSNIGTGNISVTNNLALAPYNLYFTGALGHIAIALVTVNVTNLVGIVPSAVVTQVAAGGQFAFSNSDLDLLYTQASLNFYRAIQYGFLALSADMSRLHDYVAGQSQEKLGQVFDHIKAMVDYYQEWANAGDQVQPVRMTSVPPRLRAYPRQPGVPTTSLSTRPTPWWWRGPRGGWGDGW